MGSNIRTKSLRFGLLLLLALSLLQQPALAMGSIKGYFSKDKLSSKDINYLKGVAKETWSCIDFMVNPNTQLPYDNIHKYEWTSVTNIGLYVASIAAAVDMGYLSKKTAEERLKVLLENYDQFQKWDGFTQSWNSVVSGKPSPNDPWTSTLDSGNLYAGMMVARAYFPKLKSLLTQILDEPKWASVYDPNNEKLLFGYNFRTRKLGGPLNDFGSDARLAYFLAMGKGVVPKNALEKLNRGLEERYGYQYYLPGWQGGGLFMQMISGLMVDERNTLMGQAAANFAYAQILHAKEKDYPVWGWSASESPSGGYLGMNAIEDDVVTPHASVLAIIYYPRHVVRNLKELEKMGARKPLLINGKERHFGFRDAINIKSGKVTDNYLMLDQCMLFLSLANYLNKGVIWKNFKKNPGIGDDYATVPDLRDRHIFKTLQARDLKKAVVGEVDALAKLPEPNVVVHPFKEKGMRETTAVYAVDGIKVDGDLEDWGQADPIVINRETNAEVENQNQEGNQQAIAYFMWDQTYLYFAARVYDRDLVFTQNPVDLWKDDAIELFIAPKQKDFEWGRKDCFQIGLSASGPEGKPEKWAWFQNGDPGDNVELASKLLDKDVEEEDKGYIIEAAIKWSFLGITPAVDQVIGVSPAIHFVDKNHQNEVKLNWCYLPDGKSLGKLKLVK